MIRYYLDTEFNGFGGELISLGLVRDDGESLYIVVHPKTIEAMDITPWVAENVIPILYDVPPSLKVNVAPVGQWGKLIGDFIYRAGEVPQIIVDWPSDAASFATVMLTDEPGFSWPMGDQTHITILRHIDVYPTSLEGAVHHNAWWDAMAIRQFVQESR